jgi:hypothetical protein
MQAFIHLIYLLIFDETLLYPDMHPLLHAPLSTRPKITVSVVRFRPWAPFQKIIKLSHWLRWQ